MTAPLGDPDPASGGGRLPVVDRLAVAPRAAVAGVLFALALLTLLQQFAIATIGPVGTVLALAVGGAIPGLLILALGRWRR